MTDEEWRSRTDGRLNQIEQDLAAIKTRDAVAEVHHSNVEARLESIENTLTWLLRLVVGAVIMALIGVVISGGPGL